MEPMFPVRVALFDRHSLLRDGLRLILEQAGFEVVSATANAGDFLDAVKTQTPTVAIIDLDGGMGPGSVMENMGVLRQLREFPRETKALVLSDDDSSEVVDRCYFEGASGFMQKHATAAQGVVGAVHALASGERLFPLRGLPAATDNTSHVGAVVDRGILSRLTSREREVLAYVASGADNLKIAMYLSIGERTVKAHVSSLYRKLVIAENRPQLVVLARQLGVKPVAGV